MKRLKQIGVFTLWLLIITTLFFCFSFSLDRQKETEIKEVIVHIDSGRAFITEEIVQELLENKGLLKPNKIDSISLHKIEQSISNNPFCKEVEVHKTINGKLVINICQREPLLRFFTNSGDRFYMDKEGSKMPLSDIFSERVLVVSGYLPNQVNHNASLITSLNSDGNDASAEVFLKLFNLGKYIQSNAFWKSQITQVYVNRKGEFEVYTLVGDQKVLFGNLSNMEEKFNRLKILYRDGFSKTGWDKYKTIDLRFHNQIVCKK